jgi:hypothetical protein
MMQPLSLRTQKLLLGQGFSDGECTLRRGGLVWEGRLQPTAVSNSYTVRITHAVGRLPEIFLLAPDAQAMADAVIPARKIPHVYSYEHPIRLCVYHPKKREWKYTMPLATTVIPWTIMWLSFFEDWVWTDIWSGGGEHPETRQQSAIAP